MANELRITVSFQINNPPEVDQMISSGTYDQAVAAECPAEVAVPTTAAGTAISIGAITGGQEGSCMMQNLDQTNYVDVGNQVAGTFYPVARLYPGTGNKPGKPAFFDFSPGVTLYWRANTAICKVKMLLAQK